MFCRWTGLFHIYFNFNVHTWFSIYGLLDNFWIYSQNIKIFFFTIAYIQSHHITAQHSTAQHSTAQHSTAHDTTPHHTTPHHVTPHTSHHITSHHTSHHTTHHITSKYNANLKSYYFIMFSLGKTIESLICWNYYWTVVAIFYRLFKIEFLNESERIDETISCFDVATVIMIIKMLLKSLDDWLVAFEVCGLHFDGQACSQRCTANFNRNFKPQRPWTIANDKVSEVIQSVLLQQLIFS